MVTKKRLKKKKKLNKSITFENIRIIIKMFLVIFQHFLDFIKSVFLEFF